MKSEWKEVVFEELLLIPLRNGLSKPKSVRGHGYRMVNMGEIFANDRIFDLQMDRVPLTDKEKTVAFLEEGDLLFARQSLVLSGAGKCSIIKELREPTVYESHLIRARLNQNLADSEFIYYYFSSPQGKGRINSIVEQVSAAGIRGSDLAKLKICIPPIGIQRKIALVLNALDSKIELNNKINENLQQQARTLLTQWLIENDGTYEFSLLSEVAVINPDT